MNKGNVIFTTILATCWMVAPLGCGSSDDGMNLGDSNGASDGGTDGHAGGGSGSGGSSSGSGGSTSGSGGSTSGAGGSGTGSGGSAQGSGGSGQGGGQGGSAGAGQGGSAGGGQGGSAGAGGLTGDPGNPAGCPATLPTDGATCTLPNPTACTYNGVDIMTICDCRNGVWQC